MAEDIQTIYQGQATGSTVEMQQVAPWMAGGFGLVAFAFLLYFGFAILAANAAFLDAGSRFQV